MTTQVVDDRAVSNGAVTRALPVLSRGSEAASNSDLPGIAVAANR